jgi:hypothetical protein
VALARAVFERRSGLKKIGARSQGRKAPWGHTTPIVARRLAEAKSKGELDLTILGIRVSAIDRQDEAAN